VEEEDVQRLKLLQENWDLTVEYFSSSHERSHLLCAFGMSNLPKGTPCYALLWEGV